MSVKIKHTPAWELLKTNPMVLANFLPCPVNGCNGKAKSKDKGKTFVCPDCKSIQKIQYK